MIVKGFRLFSGAGFCLTACLYSSLLKSQETPAAEILEISKKGDAVTDASIFTQRNARTMTISIPAPRGLILDREGRPLAQTKVAYHLAIDFTVLSGDVPEEEALVWAQQKITEANALLEGEYTVSARRMKNYYQNRRWLPRVISKVLSEEKAKKLEQKLPEGLTLFPIYLRHYPEKSTGAHMVGYVGTKMKIPDGPITYGDPLFETTEGKRGFEKIYDKQLSGRAGFKKVIFDGDGKLILDETLERPKPGGTVVTTLDLDWQRHAENVLRRGCERGAFVVLDVQNGDVLAMASRPTFDLNHFVPKISQEKYDSLLNDPGKPLFGRAFQAEYPPASTFKPVVGLAAITNNVVTPYTKIECPDKIQIGSQWFRNHSLGHQGQIDVKRALAKSVNPWFYLVGVSTGPQTFLSTARRLGFGSKTGLPLTGEAAGIAPSSEYIEKRMGRPTTDGDTANLAIGQGLMLATPLQVAQAMAGIANGTELHELRLLKQVQDFHGRVIEAPDVKIRNDLSLDVEAVAAVHEGMVDVVHASYGTGQNARLGFTIMCGKTGTAQWGPKSQNQGLAWFSGFFPLNNPRYAYAVVYEGRPNEIVSGGQKAAPMVRNFFNEFQDEIKKAIKPPARAMIVFEDDEEDLLDIPLAQPVDEEFIPIAEPVED
ncbi:penicillin-binding transpeptidase domain-containing protein [Akkermansiaceae bacterium]|nr:penicillin-binding transpeptidase domain-containing protein [Akkermansiaceae bacterium]